MLTLKPEEMKNQDEIAVIGLAGKFPDANNIDELFTNLKNGADSVRGISAERLKSTCLPHDENYKSCGYLENIDMFDYKLFNMAKAEADTMDPRQRLLLETVYQTIENAGYNINDFSGSNTAVFVSDIQLNYYQLADELTETMVTGNTKGFMASQISRFFNLVGSSSTVDSTCASSLVAVHQACNELILKDANYAIACGVNLDIFPFKDESIGLDIDSPDGKSRAFSADANGMSQGEVVACVLLKPLQKAIEDNNMIHAVIKGSAVNHNGQRSGSLTAPDSIAQAEVLTKAWAKAGITPEQIGFIEAHGSGTKLGDSIEIGGLDIAIKQFTDKNKVCPISTIKSNIGHGKSASGIVGLIKAILSVKHKVLFPAIHFNQPNPLINFEQSSVFVNLELKKWPKPKIHPRIAAVSSFGLSGTNCHLVLQEWEEKYGTQNLGNSDGIVIPISAQYENGIVQIADNLAKWLEKKSQSPLADIAYTFGAGRKHYEYRTVLHANSPHNLLTKIKQLINNPKAFISCRINPRLIHVYSEVNPELFRVDLMNELLEYSEFNKEYSLHIRNNAEDIKFKTFAFQLALTKLLKSFGVEINKVIGVGIGKITSDYISEVISLEKAIQLLHDYAVTESENLKNRITALFDRESSQGPVSFLNSGYGGEIFSAMKEYATAYPMVKVCDLQISSGISSFPTLIAKLYVSGHSVMWSSLYPNQSRKRIELPTYPFDYKRCWVRNTPKKRLNVTGASMIKKETANANNFLVEPGTIIEKLIAKQWCDLLNLNQISLHDNFFESGGDSLKATGSIVRLNSMFNLHLSFEDLFDFPTLKSFSQFLNEHVDTEKILIYIWKEVLKMDNLQGEDNFFEVGGHSLLANQIIQRVKQIFRVQMDFEIFFKVPTVKLQAQYLRGLTHSPDNSRAYSIPKAPDQTHYILSGTQRRLWLISQKSSGSVAYNEPGSYMVYGDLDKTALTSAFADLIRRHEVLRTSFVMHKGEPMQKIHEPEEIRFKISFKDLSKENKTDIDLQPLIRQEATTPFNLSEAPLFRVKLYQLNSEEHLLLFTIHHIISDVWSLGVIINELSKYYESHKRGSQYIPTKLNIQFKDYAHWIDQELQSGILKEQENYWLKQFGDDLPTLNLPTDYPRTPTRSFRGTKYYNNFGLEIQRGLSQLGFKAEASMFMTLTSAVFIGLHDFTGNTDIIMGFPIAGRNHIELEEQIGCYVNTLALRSKIKSTETFLEFLNQTKGTILAAYKHQNYPFDAFINQLELEHNPSRNPLFDVMIVLQNIDTVSTQFKISDLSVELLPSKHITSKYDLIITFSESEDGLMVSVEYSSELFVPQTIRLFFEKLKFILDTVVEKPDTRINQILASYSSSLTDDGYVPPFNFET